MNRHRWKQGGDHDFCTHCGLERRKVTRQCPGVNPARHWYRVWEYRVDRAHAWHWKRQRQSWPVCEFYRGSWRPEGSGE